MKKQINYKEKFKNFYNSVEWKNLRKLKFCESNGLCENCKKLGKVSVGIDVHHIVPIEKDWSKRFNIENLILLCKECHNEIHDRGGDFSKFLENWEDK